MNDRSFCAELAGQFLSNFVSVCNVAVCDDGLSLTVWATVFSVNKLEGRGGTCFLCRNLRLRMFRHVEIVLSETFFCNRRTSTCDVSLETWSIVACVFKPSQNKKESVATNHESSRRRELSSFRAPH